MLISSSLSDQTVDGLESDLQQLSVCESHLNELANDFGLIGLWEWAEISDEILEPWRCFAPVAQV